VVVERHDVDSSDLRRWNSVVRRHVLATEAPADVAPPECTFAIAVAAQP
jgi:hypothetical protein